MKKMTPIIVFGPTATGKSKLALALAQKSQGVVVNFDSCQIYSGLPILTAQPNQEDHQKAPHYLYESHHLTHRYNVARYIQDVTGLLKKLPETTPKIFVGGTGLYLKALSEGLDAGAPCDTIRDQIQSLVQDIGIEGVYQKLKQQDPSFSINPNDYQRILRRYEKLLLNQKTSEKKDLSISPLLKRGYTIVLNPDPEKLRSRIHERTSRMFNEGAIEEVETLRNNLNTLKIACQKIIGVREINDALISNETLETSQEKVFYRTCQYAKRQRTWLRHQVKAQTQVTDLLHADTLETLAETLLDKISAFP